MLAPYVFLCLSAAFLGPLVNRVGADLGLDVAARESVSRNTFDLISSKRARCAAEQSNRGGNIPAFCAYRGARASALADEAI